MKLTYKLFDTQKKVLEKFFKKYNVEYKIIDNDGDFTLFIEQGDIEDKSFDLLNKDFLTTFYKNVYAEEEISLQEQLVKILTVQNKTISVAESFTGGLLASKITSVSGASKVFYEGIVAYSIQAKMKRLKVKKQTLDSYQAVSGQVAYEMAYGLMQEKQVDFVISTTGIAGPNSDDSNFPVGLCYVAVGGEKRIKAYKFNFKGDRSQIVTKGVNYALFLAIKELRNPHFNVV
ncbi:MAG: CinA family protein [Clostridia bacterium]|nr:CinA family protein [Clostridia bacterium]